METRTKPNTIDAHTEVEIRAAGLQFTQRMHAAYAEDAKRKLRALPRAYHPFKPMRLDKTTETSPRYGNRKRTRPAS